MPLSRILTVCVLFVVPVSAPAADWKPAPSPLMTKWGKQVTPQNAWVLLFELANAGATNTGSVDPLDSLADFCAEHRLWLHADAAYGWPTVLTQEGRMLLKGIERADSIVVDPHKGFSVPFGTGVLLVARTESGWLPRGSFGCISSLRWRGSRAGLPAAGRPPGDLRRHPLPQRGRHHRQSGG